VAASLVCERLDRGTLLLIDQSPTAIERRGRRSHAGTPAADERAADFRPLERPGSARQRP